MKFLDHIVILAESIEDVQLLPDKTSGSNF